MRVRWITAWLIVLGTLSLVGCVTADPGPSPIPSSVAKSITPTPTPSPSKRIVTVPTDCRTLVSEKTSAATFGDTPLNDPSAISEGDAGVIKPTAPPPGATALDVLRDAVELRCLWKDPRTDISGLQVTMATIDAVTTGRYFDTLPADGYTCAPLYGGRQCQLVKQNEEYPVVEGHTEFLRDSIYVRVDQYNLPTKGLLGEIVARMWN